MKIGNVIIRNRLFLAPMVDVTDLPYRLICKKAGAGMCYTEMFYADAIIHENEKTIRLMKTCKEDKPVGIQVTGNNYYEFKKLIPYARNYDLIDINCGCPSIKIIGNKAGSYLLKSPSKIQNMIKVLKDSGLTTTAKIRLGFNKNNVIKVAKSIEKAGADALTVHARLAVHGTSVPADWSWIEKVKKNIGIPVIGNGDINNGESAARMLDIVDAAMIARAAIGDPDIFYRILYYRRTGKEKEFNFKRNFKYFKLYLKYAKKYDLIDIPRIKYIGSNFVRNIYGAGKLRAEIMSLKSFDAIKNFSEQLA